MRTLALIPARGGSKRIVGKNIKPLCNVPLLGWTAQFALGLPRFDHVVLSTDDADIARVGKDYGLQTLGPRPDHLASDTATTVDAALYELARAEQEFGAFDAVALLQVTTPYREVARWDTAFAHLQSDDVDAAIGVAPAVQPPELALWCADDASLLPVLPSEFGKRSQSFKPAVFVNGALYLIRTDALKTHQTFFPARSRAVICKTLPENIDIDTPDDWDNAERLLNGIARP